MDKTLLDTDILSEILKARNPAVVERAAAYKSAFGQFTTSVVAVMEIVKGLHRMGRSDALQRFLEGLKTTEVLTFDQPAAEIAGRIYADLERAGQPIGRADVMVAAIALRYGLTLVTGNTAHYQRVQNLGESLKLENWR